MPQTASQPRRLFPRCRIVPHANHEVAFLIDRQERTRWRSPPQSPRPFFYPVVGPSGETLTRMGHPGAPDHDHHRSLWFAHNDLFGHNFWGDASPCRIVQSQWFAFEDGEDAGRMAVELHWLDGHDPTPLVRQELFVTIAPEGSAGAWTLELQSDFYATGSGVEFRKNNFGILGLRMAKSIAVHFGGGVITGADGQQGEPKTFGEPNRWMDYSGPVLPSDTEEPVTEGITIIDHPRNPQHPARWHTRSDGWMGPSLSRVDNVPVPMDTPLVVRYLLHIHPGAVDSVVTEALFQAFATRPPLRRVKSPDPHVRWKLEPVA